MIINRFPTTVEGINRIERASGIKFPVAYVEPKLVITTTDPTFGYGILYARTIPVALENEFTIVIQITAPLVAYGLRGTVHAILAHEFLHYLELIWRISSMRITSDEISSSLFENMYTDETRLFAPRTVFQDNTLLNHITKRFPSGFVDYRLEDKVTKYWLGAQLPSTSVAIDANSIRLSAETLATIKFDPDLIMAIETIAEKNTKIRKKRLY